MRTKKGSILLEEIPHPKQDEIIDFVRHIRAVFTAHKMYPVGHQMIIRSIERLYHHLQKLFHTYPLLVVSLNDNHFELNGDRMTRSAPERQFAEEELPDLLQKQGIETLVFSPETMIQDLINLFSLIMAKKDTSVKPKLERIQSTMPSVQLNASIIRRNTSDKVRDKLSIEELVQSMDRDALLQELGLDPDNLPPEIQEQLERAEQAKQQEQPQQLSPDEMIEQLPEFVRSGHFVQDLLSQSPYAQRWPGIWSGQQPAPTGGHNEFTEFPIAEEPPQHLSSQSLDAIAPFQSSTQLPAKNRLDSIDWNAFRNRPVTDFPSHLQPESIVQSDQFSELMRTGQFLEYLKTYFGQQKKLSQRLQLGDPEAQEDLESPYTKAQIQESVDHLTESLYHIQNTPFFEQMQRQITSQVTTMVPELFNEYLLKLTSNNHVQTTLRNSILQDISPEKLVESQDELLGQMEAGEHEEDPAQASELLQAMVQRQLTAGTLKDVRRMLGLMEKKQENSASLHQSTEQINSLLTSHDNVSQLMEQGLQREAGEEARKLLAQLADKTAVQCLTEVFKQQNNDTKLNLIELSIDVLKDASPEKREAGLAPLLQQIDAFDQHAEQQVLLMELGRQYAPSQFEKYILKSLSQTQAPQKRTELLQQAISHDSPNLRALFQKLVLQRSFSQNPEQEELVLQYLHKTETLNAVGLIESWILDEESKHSMRQSAIWIMGAFHNEESLAVLGKILCQQHIVNEKKEHVYDEALRFQALHALTRFNRTRVGPLLNHAKKDPSLLIKTYAEELLKDVSIEKQDVPKEVLYSAETLATEQLVLDGEESAGLLDKLKKLPSLFRKE
ncbi:MAG: hypothetical protein CL920_03395 [Deltaproteobacteria bacterium]|nr:hypothetical protein [Deltaproteobacteria bacterium]